MEFKRLRTLALEIFKTINNINPNYMKNVFTLKTHERGLTPYDILAKSHKTTNYVDKNFLVFRSKIWN